MKDLILEEKAGFSSLLPFVIKEPNGNIFYASDFTIHIENGERLEFNLPLGVYKYDGSFTKLFEPVKVMNVTLPPKERNYERKRYDIKFTDNPNKCTIFYDKGLILFDNSFKTAPLYYKYCIYAHELGHHWYSTESKADLFSVKWLLDKGFNKSQIGRAFIATLSEKSFDRKMKVVELLTKNRG